MGNQSSYPSSSMSPEQAQSFIEATNSGHSVVVYSKSYCPYCTQTKQLFQAQFAAANAHVLELDQDPNGSAVQEALMKITGQRTVPNVFVKGQHIGGNDDTQAAFRSGKLAGLLSS